MPISSPSPELYTLGRGYLKIANRTSGVAYLDEDFVDVGNVVEFKVQAESEALDHKNRRTGPRTIDKTVYLESGYKGSFVLDEISLANLAMFLAGTVDGNAVKLNTALNQEYAIEFVPANPVGQRYRWRFHRVKLSPNGELSLIGDDWQTLPYSFRTLIDTATYPNDPFGTLEYLTTTTV